MSRLARVTLRVDGVLVGSVDGTAGPISTGTWHRIELSLEPTVVYGTPRLGLHR